MNTITVCFHFLRPTARVWTFLVVIGCAGSARAIGEWPAWRGPSGNGSIATGQFPTKWTAESVAWKVALPGKGSSSPIVADGKIFVTSPAEGEDAVLAFDLTGKALWQVKLGPENPPKHRTLGSSCNSSPVTDGKTIFVYFKSGHFAALDFAGKVLWKLNLTEQFGQERLFWDQGSSPVVTDRHVIVSRMHQGEWPAFTEATPTVIYFNQKPYPGPVPGAESLKVLDAYFAWRRTPEGDAWAK